MKRINASQANYFKRETLEYICSLENVFMAGAGKPEKKGLALINCLL
ncbi:MAG: hypothetical protein IPL53_18845 [Ignavibacteria bacterium]|nr:hypothetical protein [Ignavibacteria bacterium]